VHAHKHDHAHDAPHHAAHHHHHDGHTHTGGARALLVALLLTLVFAAVEALAGWWSGSLALLSDAAHMFTDSSALGLAAGAAWLARRPPSLRHSYGLVRAEVIAALFNSVLMLFLLGYIVHEAITRFAVPRAVDGAAVLGVATLGLVVNLGVAWVLSHAEESLNSRAPAPSSCSRAGRRSTRCCRCWSRA
jgi:cobalt-zinc-cadmium efflux system protein